MSYTALYRKFRPDNFDDVKGQDHIVTTLTGDSGRGVRSDDRCGKRQDQARTAGRMCRKAENGFAEGSDGKGCQTDWNQFW